MAAAAVTAANAATLGLGVRFFRFLPRSLVNRIMPKPGTGPSEQTRENGHYTVGDVHHHDQRCRYRATMAQQGDPGARPPRCCSVRARARARAGPGPALRICAGC